MCVLLEGTLFSVSGRLKGKTKGNHPSFLDGGHCSDIPTIICIHCTCYVYLCVEYTHTYIYIYVYFYICIHQTSAYRYALHMGRARMLYNRDHLCFFQILNEDDLAGGKAEACGFPLAHKLALQTSTVEKKSTPIFVDFVFEGACWLANSSLRDQAAKARRTHCYAHV